MLRDVELLKTMSAASARSIAGGGTSIVTGNIACDVVEDELLEMTRGTWQFCCKDLHSWGLKSKFGNIESGVARRSIAGDFLGNGVEVSLVSVLLAAAQRDF